MQVSYLACAKINLSLDVTGKREDGYHYLDSVMQSVDLTDLVTVRINNSPEITVTCDKLPDDVDNIAYKAAKAYLDEGGLFVGVDIKIDKNIPVKGGFGGGSADCAAVLMALNDLLEAFDQNKLLEIGASLGADVPFCMIGSTVRVRGIGEKITPISPLGNCAFVLIKNADKPSTAKMYERLDNARIVFRPDNNRLAVEIGCGRITTAAEQMINVFECLWRDENTEKIRTRLADCGAIQTVISGSGPSVFGVFDQYETAVKCVEQLKSEYREIYVCRPSRSGCTKVE